MEGDQDLYPVCVITRAKANKQMDSDISPSVEIEWDLYGSSTETSR